MEQHSVGGGVDHRQGPFKGGHEKLGNDRRGVNHLADFRSAAIFGGWNDAGFEIQRNLEGPWEPIGFADGQGTATETQTYRFC